MRKVVDSTGDAHLGEKLEIYEVHLKRCMVELESILNSQGLEKALQSQAGQNVAQYSETVRALKEFSGEDYVEGLSRAAMETVKALRDENTPRWKTLALAQILEVLSVCAGLS